MQSISKLICPVTAGLIGGFSFWWIITEKIIQKINSNEIIDVFWSNNSKQCATKLGTSGHNLGKCSDNCADVRIEKIISMLNEAKYSIDIAMHILTLNEIAATFIKAHQRGVKIRIILCTTQRNATGSQIVELYEDDKDFQSKYTKYEGIEVHSQMLDGEKSMHHKFCIIDGKNRIKDLISFFEIKSIFKSFKTNSILLNGSCNWTKQGMYSNWENILVTNNGKLLELFENEFEVMWNEFERKSATSVC